MQLKRKQSVAELLALATCSLLTPVAQNAQAIEEDLDLDLSYLEYQEDNRVRVREVDISAVWLYDEDNTFSGKIITDAITGATPSGALVIPGSSDTLSTPSGVAGATGSTAAVNSLVDFVDRRVSASANWSHIHNRLYRYSVGGIISNEDDYASYGFNGSVARDYNEKLTTVEGGIGLSYDIVGSSTGIQKQLGSLEDDKPDSYKDGEKVTIDWGVSVTQILSRSALVKAGISSGSVHGYLSDPYKIITVINAFGKNPTDYDYYHEKRPDSRTRNSLNLDYNQKLDNDDIAALGYRFFWDDWGITSNTLDVRYRHELLSQRYIQYHARLYLQSAADFYYPYLDGNKDQEPGVDGGAPTNASADYRLDKMTSVTVGIKYGLSGSLGKFFARAEVMRQMGDAGDYRTLTAKMLQLVWTLDFKK